MSPRPTSEHDETWEDKFHELADFLETHGHCLVPRDWTDCPGLYDWVLRQRYFGRRGRLSKERRRRLEQLGFVWRAHDLRWNQKYAELCRLQSLHGHLGSQAERDATSSLAAWIARQRVLRAQGKLSPDRLRLLERIGFLWEPREGRWDRRYREVLAFVKQHGHPNVPDRWPGNPLLAKWVGHQRAAAKAGTLSAGRRRLLDSLGFRWEGRPATRMPRGRKRPGPGGD